mgnify:CR=1 FL=1
MIPIIGFRYRKYTHYTLYGSFPPIYGIAIIRSLLSLFLAHFHESANICVAIKCGSTVRCYYFGHFLLSYQQTHWCHTNLLRWCCQYEAQTDYRYFQEVTATFELCDGILLCHN